MNNCLSVKNTRNVRLKKKALSSSTKISTLKRVQLSKHSGTSVFHMAVSANTHQAHKSNVFVFQTHRIPHCSLCLSFMIQQHLLLSLLLYENQIRNWHICLFSVTIYSIEGGTTKNYGYLVAEYKGTKATVCSPVWSSSGANTVCKQLGYSGGQAYFGPTDKPTIQDVMAANIDCNSHATLLDMCRTGDWEVFKVGNEASANYTCTQGPVKVFCYAECEYCLTT